MTNAGWRCKGRSVISYREEIGNLNVDLINATHAVLQDLHGLRVLEMRLERGRQEAKVSHLNSEIQRCVAKCG
jgi:hypothetical protein